jgi:hypothetical protein
VFNYAVNILAFTRPNDWRILNNKLERMWKDAVMDYCMLYLHERHRK